MRGNFWVHLGLSASVVVVVRTIATTQRRNAPCVASTLLRGAAPIPKPNDRTVKLALAHQCYATIVDRDIIVRHEAYVA
jgi:hypothetical protein